MKTGKLLRGTERDLQVRAPGDRELQDNPRRHLPFPNLTLLFRDAFVDTNTSFRSVKRFLCAPLIPAYLGFPRTRAQRRLNGPDRISEVAVGVVGMLYSCEMCLELVEIM